ncbi:MAG: type 4a pilus biogenesis protein PilO [Phycisphaeraceae bacterium]|nr:type 4a pilus biogenesis protein PilO [Phycisphaeraceae bacterium]MCW5755275.1 type 4a pilus biogenesis protein PilO [Phycisphaeraceae bacterium]
MKFGMREIVLLVVLLALPVASYLLVFKPQNESITRAKAEIGHKQEMLRQLSKETARNEDLRRANDIIQVRIAEVEDRLPSEKEVDRVIRQVSDLAVRAGLSAPAMQNLKQLQAAQYWEQPLEVKTSGTFKGYYEFLLSLERMPRITRIPDVKLVRSRGTDGMMDITFTLSIYYQNDGGGSR